MKTKPLAIVQEVESLLGCLAKYSEQQTNPVFEILAEHNLELEKKYPDPALACHEGLLRVFYHYHEQPFQFTDEHGHFHFFVKCSAASAKPEWSHVAGLCMDSQGQPIRWFTVNHWVSAGEWLDSDKLINIIDQLLPCNDQEPLLNQWLVSIFLVFKDLIADLLIQRDQKLKILHSARDDILEDRQIYIMSELKFDLFTELSSFCGE